MGSLRPREGGGEGGQRPLRKVKLLEPRFPLELGAEPERPRENLYPEARSTACP